MKRLFALLAALALVLSLTACEAEPVMWPVATGVSVETVQADRNAPLRLPVPEGDAPNPLRTRSRQWVSFYRMIYEPLVSLDEAEKPTPFLCETWTSPDDGLTWVFTLRSDIFFHDGTPLTAEIVARSCREAKEAGTSVSFYAEALEHVERVEATAQNIVTVTLKTSGIMALYAMNCPITLPATQAEGEDSQLPYGTGPYRVLRDYERGDANDTGVLAQLELRGNTNWWQRPPQIERVVAVPCAGEESVLANLALQRLSVAPVFSPNSFGTAETGRTAITQISTRQFEFLAPNVVSGPMANLTVRKAVAHAVDAEAIVRSVYQGRGMVADTPVSPNTYLFDAMAPVYETSLELARSVLEEAGYIDIDDDGIREAPNIVQDELVLPGKLTVRLLVESDEDSALRREAANSIANMLLQAGIETEVLEVTGPELDAALADGGFDLALLGMQMGQTPDLSPLLHTQGAGNAAKVGSAEMDALLDAAKTAASLEEAQAAYSALQRHISSELPIFGLFFRSGALYYQRALQGVRIAREMRLYKDVSEWYYH